MNNLHEGLKSNKPCSIAELRFTQKPEPKVHPVPEAFVKVLRCNAMLDDLLKSLCVCLHPPLDNEKRLHPQTHHKSSDLFNYPSEPPSQRGDCWSFFNKPNIKCHHPSSSASPVIITRNCIIFSRGCWSCWIITFQKEIRNIWGNYTIGEQLNTESLF